MGFPRKDYREDGYTQIINSVLFFVLFIFIARLTTKEESWEAAISSKHSEPGHSKCSKYFLFGLSQGRAVSKTETTALYSKTIFYMAMSV